MMEAVRTSETSVNFIVITRRYISEDSKHHCEISVLLCYVEVYIHSEP
jgi:hypothetical protein